MERWIGMWIEKLTPLVVRGSEGGTRAWNSPWFTRESGFLFADIFLVMQKWNYNTNCEFKDRCTLEVSMRSEM
jgi:hypothetical protein